MDSRNIKDLPQYKKFPDNFDGKIIYECNQKYFKYRTELNIILNIFNEFKKNDYITIFSVFFEHLVLTNEKADSIMILFKDVVLIDDVVYFINDEKERVNVVKMLRQSKIKTFMEESW